MKSNSKMIGAGLLAAAGIGAFFAWKNGVFNFSDGATAGYDVPPGLDPSKARAQRWLESQLTNNRHLDVPRAEVINQAMGMETGRAQHFAQALKRLKGDSVTYETVSPWGVGRPE
jgi:hypothetical protein